jgi:hypothetical protein
MLIHELIKKATEQGFMQVKVGEEGGTWDIDEFAEIMPEDNYDYSLANTGIVSRYDEQGINNNTTPCFRFTK